MVETNHSTPQDIHFPDGRVTKRPSRRLLEINDTFADEKGEWVVVLVEPGEDVWRVWVEETAEPPGEAA